MTAAAPRDDDADGACANAGLGGEPLSVLVVDDNPLNIELATFVLAADGCRISSAEDAPQAMRSIEAHSPDVILMDIQLPGMDGVQLTRRLKSHPSTHGIVVLAFTAFAMKGDEAKLVKAGCDGYLSKPIDVATFAASVRRQYLEARRRRQGGPG